MNNSWIDANEGKFPPPPQGLELSIAIAAYREAENLKVLLPVIREAAAALASSFEIVVVDTQEPLDNTAEICLQNGVRHVFRRGGNSYGDAVRTIISETRGRYLLNLDADGSHSSKYFPSLWAKRFEYDITIGSRYVRGGHTENPFHLIAMSYLVNLTFRAVFSIRAKDVTNSFRLYRREVLDTLRLESNDFDILEEILIKAAMRNPPARIGEVPVTFGRRASGESKRKLVQFALGYFATLNRLRSLAKADSQEISSK